MYPLDMKHAEGGFARANDEAEHRALSDAGYEPKLADTEAAALAPKAPFVPADEPAKNKGGRPRKA
jgi:hypothetical protein